MSTAPTFGPNGKYKTHLNDEERDRYCDLRAADEPITKESEFYFKVMDYNDDKENDKRASTKRTRRKSSTGASTRKKTKPGPVNEDGYPIQHCRYEPVERRLMYQPYGYATEANP